MMPGAPLAEPLRVIEDSDTVFELELRLDHGSGLRQTSPRGQTEETLALAVLERVEPRARYATRRVTAEAVWNCTSCRRRTTDGSTRVSRWPAPIPRM